MLTNTSGTGVAQRGRLNSPQVQHADVSLHSHGGREHLPTAGPQTPVHASGALGETGESRRETPGFPHTPPPPGQRPPAPKPSAVTHLWPFGLLPRLQFHLQAFVGAAVHLCDGGRGGGAYVAAVPAPVAAAAAVRELAAAAAAALHVGGGRRAGWRAGSPLPSS
ncbi:hypothetical protein EYF80_065626 [Liparis tanakae]|uniref:Uncharacterized protein n=1 Tax=Liparis tanakae TaxID=230148 RepID=A0A4Z2E670_9TELE|nr:hypothetical protein EYF80_065626 [Liparis tanakae]